MLSSPRPDAPSPDPVIQLDVVTEVTPELLQALDTLMPQLGADLHGPDAAHLQRVLDTPGLTMLIARDTSPEGGGRIVGTLSLLVYHMPSHTLSLFEDVVVDRAARGRGIGALLVQEGLRLARAAGAVQTDLLSNDRRAAAIRLYERHGFRRFVTNVFRYGHGDGVS